MTLALLTLLLTSVGVVIALGTRTESVPLLILLICSVVFGLTANLSFAYTIRSMSDGFAAAAGSIGVVVVAGAIAGAGAEWRQPLPPVTQTGCSRQKQLRLPAGVAILGLLAGLAAVTEYAFVLLMSLIRSGADRRQPVSGTGLMLALSIGVTSAVLLPAPGPVAAMTILAADPWHTLRWGAVVAAITAAAGWAFALAATGGSAAATGEPHRGDLSRQVPIPSRGDGPMAAGLVVVLPVLLLLASSAGHLPGEPLGGGATRELLLTLGSPMTLLLAASLGVLAVRLALLSRRKGRFAAEGLQRALAGAAPLAMLVAAVGAFSQVVENVGLAEMLLEKLTGLPLGILLPFLLAAVVKLVYGSSTVAVITAAGFVQPLLPQLGLDDQSGRALCAVAVGAGSMVASHVNDTLFWTFTRLCNLTPAQGLRLLTLGTLVQGVAAAVTLLVISAVVR